jgi:hypothetical protein
MKSPRKGIRALSSLAILLTLALWPAISGATPPVQLAKLTAKDGLADDRFGHSVAVDEYTMVVGAYRGDSPKVDTGTAYVYIRSGSVWKQQAKLGANYASAYDRFGYSVSVSGDTLVIGAPYDDDRGLDSGSVHVFVRSGSKWIHQAKLLASDGSAKDFFGWSVSIDGETVVVGAYHEGKYGAAYVFSRSGATWTEQAKLTASDRDGRDSFGYSVALDSELVIIGAPRDDSPEGDSGSAYVFARDGSTWSEQAKLVAADGANRDHFGYAVSLSGHTALVGSPYDDDLGSASGSAYVYALNGSTWTQQTKLLASDGTDGEQFGMALALDGETAVIGATRGRGIGGRTGAAYLLVGEESTWVETAKLTASDGAPYDYFGTAVSVSGSIAGIGAPLDDDRGDGSGSAYVFKLPRYSCMQELSKVVAADGMKSAQFGYSVSLDGNTAVVGASRDISKPS